MLADANTINTISMDILSKSLIERFRRRELGHFYILQGRHTPVLKDWMNELLLAILCDDGMPRAQAQGRLERGHPDILWLTPQEHAYKIENADFDPLFQAMAHRPLELPWRFIVVEKPETISEVYANKLLKTLEEPNPACTIIFLQEQGRSLLATIESRAIKLTLPQQQTHMPGGHTEQALHLFLAHWCQQYPDLYEGDLAFPAEPAALASELAALARSNAPVEENLFTAISVWTSQHIAKAQVLDRVLQAIKHANFSRRLNNSCHERFYTLIQSLELHA